MLIVYNAKYPQLVCVVLLSSIFCSAAQNCGKNNASTEFQNNLKIVLDNLVDNTSSSNGFSTSSYGQSPDTVYGLLQCRGDTTAEECLSCSQHANSSMLNACKNVSSGRSMLDKCFVRYENHSFFGKLGANVQVVYNRGKVKDEPEEFKAAVKELFSNLLENALQSPKRYSSGSNSTTTFYTINGLLQCWMDLTSVGDCNTCLNNAIRGLLDATFSANGPFQGGVGLCGSCFARYETYSFFHPAPPPPPSPVQPLSPPPSPPPTTKNSSNKIGMAVGISGGLMLVMLLLCMFAIQRKLKSGASWKPAILKNGNLDSELDSEIRQEREMIFSLQNIKAATNNFHEDNKLGEGGFGSVYKGTMPNGMQIAVKRLSIKSSQGKKQFLNEVKLVAKIQHRNLVNLLGYSTEGVERLLVYEFLPNKSLDTILFHPQRIQELDWTKRLNIILGVARGLLYLHQDSQLQIIHRDIKASNILLDEKMQPKISDFGLAKLFNPEETHVSTMVAGTLGYMAPEYAINRQLSVKADVYSFGVVILEIISGRKNNDSRLSVEFQSLLEWVWRYYKEGNIIEIIDKSMLNCYPNEQVGRCIHVGLLCTQASPVLRPPMVNAYAMLSNASVTNLPNPTKPAYLSITQDNVPRHASTSTSASTTSSTLSTAHLAYPSINDTSITDLGPR